MKYKVKIKESIPLFTEIAKKEKCFLGISVNNPLFLHNKITVVFDWIFNNFKGCKIVVGDHLHRINEYILNGKSEEDAIAEGKIKGEIIWKYLSEKIEKFPNGFYEIEFWEEYYYDVDCINEKKYLSGLFDNNQKFKEHILKIATKFIDRQIECGCYLYVDRETAINFSVEYLLEELAVFSILIERGYKFQVYPGTQLTILKKIASGEFIDIETPLKKGIYIDLTIKKMR